MELDKKVVKALQQFKTLYPELEQLAVEYDLARGVEKAAEEQWKKLQTIVLSGTPLTPKQLEEYRATHAIVYGDPTYPKYSARHDMEEKTREALFAVYRAFNSAYLEGYLDQYGQLKRPR